MEDLLTPDVAAYYERPKLEIRTSTRVAIYSSGEHLRNYRQRNKRFFANMYTFYTNMYTFTTTLNKYVHNCYTYVYIYKTHLASCVCDARGSECRHVKRVVLYGVVHLMMFRNVFIDDSIWHHTMRRDLFRTGEHANNMFQIDLVLVKWSYICVKIIQFVYGGCAFVYTCVQ